jgi:hypothetical protein
MKSRKKKRKKKRKKNKNKRGCRRRGGMRIIRRKG